MPSGAQLAVFLTRALGRMARLAGQPADHGPVDKLERSLATGGYRGLQLSVLISVALAFGLAAATTQSAWLAGVRLVLGPVLVGEGYVLATNWRHGRRLIVWRVQHEPTRNSLVRTSAARHLLDFCLQLAGVVWLALGGYLIWLGVVPLV